MDYLSVSGCSAKSRKIDHSIVIERLEEEEKRPPGYQARRPSSCSRSRNSAAASSMGSSMFSSKPQVPEIKETSQTFNDFRADDSAAALALKKKLLKRQTVRLDTVPSVKQSDEKSQQMRSF